MKHRFIIDYDTETKKYKIHVDGIDKEGQNLDSYKEKIGYLKDVVLSCDSALSKKIKKETN
jgi:hypothetical protein